MNRGYPGYSYGAGNQRGASGNQMNAGYSYGAGNQRGVFGRQMNIGGNSGYPYGAGNQRGAFGNQMNAGYPYGAGSQRTAYGRQMNTGGNPQWEVVKGKVVSFRNSADVFRGSEILEVSVVDASLMDAPSVILGRQKIPLQPGQPFPIPFEFYYDKSRAGPGSRGLTMQARITTANDQLMYINDTTTPLKRNVKIDVKRV